MLRIMNVLNMQCCSTPQAENLAPRDLNGKVCLHVHVVYT